MENEIKINELVDMTVDEIGAKDRGCYLFFDWFCKDNSLKNKANRLLGVVRKLHGTKTAKIDFEKSYVFFKNNCPCYGDGRLYDSLSVCDIESGKVQFFIAPRNPFGKVELAFEGHGFENGTESLQFDKMADLYRWFKNN